MGGPWPPFSWGRKTSCSPPSQTLRKRATSQHPLPGTERRPPGPAPPECFAPRLPPAGSFPSSIPYSFLFPVLSRGCPIPQRLGLLLLPMNCLIIPLPYDMPDFPQPSYDSHNFPSPLALTTDSKSNSPDHSESNTSSVASPSPSELAYDADSKSVVPCAAGLLPNLGGRPC